uniref:Uncharacterized protein n=1 Tax=Solanum tuberosum TaxID=4113 RepID=M1CZF7_SOLTU
MSMITADYPAVIYFRNGLHEYYKIDLDSLPERLSPIANFTEDFPVWTVIDECIGGRKEANETNHFTVGSCGRALFRTLCIARALVHQAARSLHDFLWAVDIILIGIGKQILA